MENSNKKYITVSEAKALLGMKSSEGVIDMIADGRLKGINISKGKKRPTWRVDVDSISNLKQ